MSFEDRKFTKEEVIRSLRLCADGRDCKDCDFFEADCPRGYNPCHEFHMMELAAKYLEEPIKVETYCDCGCAILSEKWAYCPICGEPIDWIGAIDL